MMVDMMVDSMIAEFRQRIEKDCDGSIKLSDLKAVYKGFGELTATDGVFSYVPMLTKKKANKSI